MAFAGSGGGVQSESGETDPALIYESQPGDNLWGIADKCTDTTPELMIVYEGLKPQVANPNEVSVGKRLNLSEFSDIVDCPS